MTDVTVWKANKRTHATKNNSRWVNITWYRLQQWNTFVLKRTNIRDIFQTKDKHISPSPPTISQYITPVLSHHVLK